MKAVYDSVIEIVIPEAFYGPRHKALEFERKLDSIGLQYRENTQEWAILKLLSQQARVAACDGKDGYLGSETNCAFSVLYEIFRVDLIAFMFNQAWVPHKIVDPFSPRLFLERLAVLERATGKLQEGDALPILTHQTEFYLWPGITPVPSLFLGEKHALLARHSLHQLRDFGELAVRLERHHRNMAVEINIFQPDEEILAFTVHPAKPDLRSLTHLIQ